MSWVLVLIGKLVLKLMLLLRLILMLLLIVISKLVLVLVVMLVLMLVLIVNLVLLSCSDVETGVGIVVEFVFGFGGDDEIGFVFGAVAFDFNAGFDCVIHLVGDVGFRLNVEFGRGVGVHVELGVALTCKVCFGC